jgi:hypothetical protein
MAETLQSGAVRTPQLVRAAQVAREAEVRQSANGVAFATYGETGVDAPDLDRMLETVPAAIVAALKSNTYYFVPLALRENPETGESPEADANAKTSTPANEPTMVAGEYTDAFSDAAICHRNVELGSGNRGVFISTRLLGDRFALSFEFFINVAHAFVDQAGVPSSFADLVWKQALDNVRGETSLDAWESRNLAFGRPANADPEPLASLSRRGLGLIPKPRSFSGVSSSAPATPATINEKERGLYIDSAFSDAVALYLLSLALDFDYSELREREYPLLAPAALAARLRLVADLFPPNQGYEFAVKYRRRA